MKGADCPFWPRAYHSHFGKNDACLGAAPVSGRFTVTAREGKDCRALPCPSPPIQAQGGPFLSA
jgi:hypothetical protein